MIDLSEVSTEQRNLNTQNFSSISIGEAIKLMNLEDINAVKCVQSQFSKIEKLIKHTSRALKNGNRIIYIGAGTSGRLGVLDAVECSPTFGVDYNTIVGIMAGGEKAFVKAEEGAEDSKENGKIDLEKINLKKDDIIIGIAASGRTPYVIGALEYAQKNKCVTGAIVSSFNSQISKIADITIEIVPGPEVLTGSTRLKAGTATKLVLNMISTISMKEIGKIYKNYMVDLKLSNKKLFQRGVNIVMDITGVDFEKARTTLEKADNYVKVAIVMILLDCDKKEAYKRLEKSGQQIENIVN